MTHPFKDEHVAGLEDPSGNDPGLPPLPGAAPSGAEAFSEYLKSLEESDGDRQTIDQEIDKYLEQCEQSPFPTPTCLTPSELESLATSDNPSESRMLHVSTCSFCQRAVQAACPSQEAGAYFARQLVDQVLSVGDRLSYLLRTAITATPAPVTDFTIPPSASEAALSPNPHEVALNVTWPARLPPGLPRLVETVHRGYADKEWNLLTNLSEPVRFDLPRMQVPSPTIEFCFMSVAVAAFHSGILDHCRHLLRNLANSRHEGVSSLAKANYVTTFFLAGDDSECMRLAEDALDQDPHDRRALSLGLRASCRQKDATRLRVFLEHARAYEEPDVAAEIRDTLSGHARWLAVTRKELTEQGFPAEWAPPQD